MKTDLPRGPRMRTVNLISAVCAMLIAALFLLATLRIYRAYDNLRSATEKYVSSEMAATTLKQGSDNLTAQVRLFTVTRDPAYLRAYFAEVASSNRERAVETLDRYLEGTDAHRYLESALASSIELMDREYYAMVLVLDATGGQIEPGMEALEAVRLSDADRALDAEGKLALAVRLMHDEGYLRYDNAIDEDVTRCIESLNAEREAVQRESLDTLSRMQTQQTICAALLVAMILLSVTLTAVYMIRPISADVKLLADDKALPLRGSYELQYLENAYNSMYEQRKEHDTLVAERIRALELVERERTSLNIIHALLHSGMWSMDFNESGEMVSVSWSEEFRRMLGYESEADFPNTLEAWSELLHEDDRERVLKEFNDTIRDYSGQRTYDVEYRLLTKDRGWRWFHAVGRLSRRANGSPVTYVGMFVDITERKEMQERLDEQQRQLEEALEEAQAASRAKTTFLTNMSHDIRTPMNAIIGFTTLANSHAENSDAVKSYLGKIATSSEHLLSLINDILDMSRIESGHIELQEQECSLSEVMHDIKTITQADTNAKRLEFYVDTLDVVDENVFCDKTRLDQMLLNVLSNSIKFTPAGGTVSVRVRQLPHPDEGFAAYEFRIKDTGIGMSQEFQAHIFEAFERERTSTVSGLQGTGLGLAITKNIVDMMHGEIAVKSEEGKGTEFTITLPLRVNGAIRLAEASEPEASPALPAANGPLSFDGRSVLLVEDNEINQEISKMILEDAGFSVDVADDGSVAVEKVRAAEPGRYDLILMDIQMPIMNGYEATRQIRALDSPLAGIPIIALSANAFAEDRLNSLDAGMNDHLGKPIDVEHLLTVLRQYLDRSDK